jgi:repressor of nif and glnA expression
MTFSAESCEGSVIVNVSTINPDDRTIAAREIQLVLDDGLGVGKRVIVAGPGEPLGATVVPDGALGIATVCSVTLNGILQKRGIPVASRFGGLLEIRERQPVRFVDMIEYKGSTLDPLEVFVRAGMTRVRNVVLRGSGIICASFREVPAVAVPDIRAIERKIRGQGLSGILEIGRPSRPLFGIPVAEGYCGMVVAGGLNPVAALHETGVRVMLQSLAGLEPFGRFMSVRAAMRRHG